MNNPWLHRGAVLLALCTLLLVATGDAVTSNDQRPMYSFGQIHFWTAAAGILTIGLAIGLSRADPRAWLRRLGWTAVGAVAVQAVLGLQSEPLPPAVRFCHAFLAQLFFTAVVAIAVCTSSGWMEGPGLPESRSFLRFMAKVTPALVLLQVTLGLAFRHGLMGVGLHIAGAFAVLFFILGLTLPVIYAPEPGRLSAAAKTLLAVASLQVFLGLALFIIRSMDEIDPVVVIVATMVHAAVGALTLAASLAMALLVLRGVGEPAASPF